MLIYNPRFAHFGNPIVTAPLFESSITSLSLISKGKVRDIYAIDDEKLLIVTTDRLSAFDVILPDPIPRKGEVLQAVANFWFEKLGHVVPNQLTGIDPETVVAANEREQVRGRAVVVKRLKPLPIEAVVRGYVIGSGWKGLPADRRHLRHRAAGRPRRWRPNCRRRSSPRQPRPRSATTTKTFPTQQAAANCDTDAGRGSLAPARTDAANCAPKPATPPSACTRKPPSTPPRRGIIIADTKFEFGIDAAGTLHLIDEALTPDSSRFWPADQYVEGQNPPSYDKQYVRDYLETLDWGKVAPARSCRADVIARPAPSTSRPTKADRQDAVSAACPAHRRSPCAGVVLDPGRAGKRTERTRAQAGQTSVTIREMPETRPRLRRTTCCPAGHPPH